MAAAADVSCLPLQVGRHNRQLSLAISFDLLLSSACNSEQQSSPRAAAVRAFHFAPWKQQQQRP